MGEEVLAAFLSDSSLPCGARVLPLFLGEGRHGAADAPALAARCGAQLLPSLAAHADRIADLACERMRATGEPVNALFGLYSFSGFAALQEALRARSRQFVRVAFGALHGEPSITSPSIASVLAQWRREEVSPVRLQPMLLFNGRSMDAMAAMAGGHGVEILPPLSQGEGFAELIGSLLVNE